MGGAFLADCVRGPQARHGSVENYLDFIGYDAEWRAKLRQTA